jgi:glutaredoxin
MYGSEQCEQTKKQLAEVAGLDSAYQYVDCGVGASSAREACEAQGVHSFPTWLINGQRINGALSKRELEQACDHVARV